jgi:uncharacterized SAM-binding protein YcdF (DUF218 family)
MKSIAFFLVLLMIWGVGLLAFTSRIEHSTPPREPEAADGIVVLTGASVRRINAATGLLEAEKGQRMLVSGVNRQVTPEELRLVSKAAERLFRCCVDMGFQAANTVGNARETAAWAAKHKFDDLIVVTADYHMPRSLLEIRSALPNAKLTPYPVVTDEMDAANWWRTGRRAKRMVLEYCKYLAILARETVLSLGPRAKGGADLAGVETPEAAAVVSDKAAAR